MVERKVMDNPKPRLKQKQPNHGKYGFNVNLFRKNDVQYLGTLC
jgi:hypothetical protein